MLGRRLARTEALMMVTWTQLQGRTCPGEPSLVEILL